MSRMKTFLKYLIVIALFYVFSNIMINALLKISYSKITAYTIDVKGAFVDVTEAKASRRDGYIKGKIKNNTQTAIENKYLKISMLSKNNNVLGEKYIKIESLKPEEVRNFEVRFDYDNVKTFKVEMVDSMPEEEDFLELIKQNAKDLFSQNILEKTN